MSENHNPKTTALVSDAKPAILKGSKSASTEKVGALGEVSNAGLAQIERVLTTLANSLHVEQIVEDPSRPQEASSQSKPNYDTWPDSHVIRQLDQQVECLEQTNESQTFEREVRGLRELLTARMERFEQPIKNSLLSCVRSLERISYRLKWIENDALTRNRHFNSALEKVQKQLRDEVSLHKTTQDHVQSLLTNAGQYVSNFDNIWDQLNTQRQESVSSFKQLTAECSGIESRLQEHVATYFEEFETAQNKKLLSLERALAKLAHTNDAEHLQWDEVRSQLQTSLNEAHTRLSACEESDHENLKIMVQHAEANCNRIKDLYKSLQKLCAGGPPTSCPECA